MKKQSHIQRAMQKGSMKTYTYVGPTITQKPGNRLEICNPIIKDQIFRDFCFIFIFYLTKIYCGYIKRLQQFSIRI